ncbi:hypothetical protein E4T56_gene12019 [Termitomyces sp. T112]|nr:hypothetical protein E4T56_gene12019 [Termitomyces sp. T112]
MGMGWTTSGPSLGLEYEEGTAPADCATPLPDESPKEPATAADSSVRTYPSKCPAKPPNPRPPSAPTLGNSNASPANSDNPLANSDAFSTVLDTSSKLLEPSPATPDPTICLQPPTLVHLTCSRASQ